MKIVHLVHSFEGHGGIESYVRDLLPLLEARGHANALVDRVGRARGAPDQAPFSCVQRADSARRYRGRVIEVIQQEDPDVIFVHDVYDPELVAQAARIAPTVGYIHIFYPVCPGLAKLYRRGDEVCVRPYGLGCIPKIYLRRCASARHPRSVYRIMKATKRHLEAHRSLRRVIVASTYMRALLEQNGFTPDRIEILPYFVSLPASLEKGEAPAERPPAALFAGRLEYEKGLPYLLRALSAIEVPHQLFVAGDGSLREQYVRLARDLGLADRVHFLGWLPSDQLHARYRRCAVTVMPTIMPEPFGMVGVEAMAHGRPVVAFQVGGIADWLTHGQTGFLVPPRDVEGLAANITQLLASPKLAESLGANARNVAQTRYSAGQHIDRLVEILEAAASG